jgi:uncharacterized MAPEG superfamily protein
MSVPVWVLLGFAGWTLAGRSEIREWRADEAQGSDWYRRAMRAHANCIENLPVYAAIVVAIVATGVRSPTLDRLAVALLAARVCQTTTHVAFTPTNFASAVRFAFFAAQLLCMIGMGVEVVRLVH